MPPKFSPHTSPQTSPAILDCEVLVVGSGASGLTAAIAAHHLGLKAAVVEKDAYIGGCSAYSHGMLWLPGNPLATRAGIEDSHAAACDYLRSEMGTAFDEGHDEIQLYLQQGPQMVRFLEDVCGLRFELRHGFPDYRSERPGAAQNGRTILPASYNARALGASLRQLMPPRASLFGLSLTPSENRLISTRSAAGMRLLARRLLRLLADRVTLGRNAQLAGGAALVAGLLQAALARGIPIHTKTSLKGLLRQGDRVVGAVVERADGKTQEIHAQRGVVLACGGWGHALTHDGQTGDCGHKAALADAVPPPQSSWSLAPRACVGDGLRAALQLGAALQTPKAGRGFWSPASRLPGPAGRLSAHSHDRFKPGFLAVTPDGRRFANEAESNHHFCESLLQATPAGQMPTAWLVCDRRALMQTGLGDLVHGAPFPIGQHLRSGYLLECERLDVLAQAMGVDPAVFTATVAQFNANARAGHDPEYGKGSTRFNRAMGRPGAAPNPCLGPVEQGPFYAVQIGVAHMATLAGLDTDLQARVLDARQAPIAGLYAAGNDRANVFRGGCPGGGITLGPGMTWAYVAAHSLAGVPVPAAAAAPASTAPLPAQRPASALPARPSPFPIA